MSSRKSYQRYEFGPYRLDAAERILTRNSREIRLTPTLFEILLALVENGNHILEKERLIERVWPERFVEEGNLSRNISTLRGILEDDSRNPRYIETIPRRGYRFVAAVKECGPKEAAFPSGDTRFRAAIESDAGTNSSNSPGVEGIQSAFDGDNRHAVADTPHVGRIGRVSNRLLRMGLLAFGSFSLVALLVVARVVSFDPDRNPTPHSSVIESLAVLPLENLSGDPEQEYLADGLTEILISNLAKISALKVISRTSAMHYKGTRKRLPEIAQELGVQGVVEGSVMRSGSRVRITIQLVEAATDLHIWTESYERNLVDLLALQSEVAQTIARRIEIEVTEEEGHRLGAAASPVSPQIHEAYLKGLFFKNKRTVESLDSAIEHFERAMEKDPDFAPAYAAMADAYFILATWHGPRGELWPKARAAATRALEIDNTLAEAHVVRGGVLLCHDFDPAAAEREFLRALHLNPGDAPAHRRYSYSLASQGRFEESLAAGKRAVELDPVSIVNNTMLGRSLYFARRYDEALEQLQSSLRLDPNLPWTHRFLGFVYLQQGMKEEAIVEMEKALTQGGGRGILGDLGYAYAVSNRTSQALQQLKALQELEKEGRASAFSLAVVHHGLGNKDEALAWLRAAYDERDDRLVLLKVDPLWDALRPDPRFQQLLHQIGPEL